MKQNSHTSNSLNTQHKESTMNDLTQVCWQLQLFYRTQNGETAVQTAQLMYTLYMLTTKIHQLVSSWSKQHHQHYFNKQNSDVKMLLQWFEKSACLSVLHEDLALVTKAVPTLSRQHLWQTAFITTVDCCLAEESQKKQITERSDDAQYSLGSSIQCQLQSGSPVQSSLSLSLPPTFHRLFFFFGLPFSNFEDDRDIDRLPGGRPRRRSDADSLCREDDGRKREDGDVKLPPSPW